MNTSLSDDEFDGLLADERPLDQKPCGQSLLSMPRWQSRPRRLHELFKRCFQIVCLVMNITGLIIISFSYLSLHGILHSATYSQCGLATDSLLGENIGWNTITIDNDPRFVDADPGDFDSKASSSIWGEIYSGAWIWVSDPSKVGYGGGVKLIDFAENPNEFDETTEGFAIAVMHQLHCVALLKRSLMQYRRDGMSTIDDEHQDHCVEYLRQAVMCNSDLTLERPENMTFPHGSSGWGEAHRCRDWNKVFQAIRKHSIGRGRTGWKKRIFPEEM
ncbi:hypothetical protein F5884DRAFT_877752 [Xylogone sp. PMI_703]|nr:hypothetical protein F5884DRAFT_877752 [Xylogone sp. PMI_703]